MRHLWLVALTALIASPLCAQPRPSGGLGNVISGGLQAQGTIIHFLLLDQPSVQQELRISPDQVQRARQVGEAQRRKLEGLGNLPREEAARRVADANATGDQELKAILSAEQFQRLREIGLQQVGPLAVARPDVAQDLGLTREQVQQVRSLQEDLIRTTAESLPQGGGRRFGPGGLRGAGLLRGGLQDSIARFQAARRDTEARILAVLTAEQKSAWTSLQGAPFHGPLNMPGGRLLGR